MIVYVVTSGECSDYRIEKIFFDRDNAENYALNHNFNYEIEEYELCYEKHECPYKIYYIQYYTRPDYSLYNYEVKIQKHKVERTFIRGRNFNLGYIPIECYPKNDDVCKKIIFDDIEKRKAEHLRL